MDVCFMLENNLVGVGDSWSRSVSGIVDVETNGDFRKENVP